MSRLTVRLVRKLPSFTLNVGWEVTSGITVLFGYSGAGKSLTLSMLTGTMKPDVGRISLGERVLLDTAQCVDVPPQKRRIGYVSQAAELFPHMTVRRNIEYALKGVDRTMRRSRVDELLEAMDIAGLSGSHPRQISGGQRQRAALARALAPSPDLLVLDEPFSALDLPVRTEMRRMLVDVHRSTGVPIVMVTHDLYEACALADTLVVYSGTGAVQVGSPRELIGSPGTPEIKRLLRAMEIPKTVFAHN